MPAKWLIAVTIALTAAAVAWSTWPGQPPATKLAAVIDDIRRDHPTVTQITPAEYETLSARSKNALVVLDVREAAEYGVSHLDGARRVDPAMSAEDFARDIGPALTGKTVVLYCSVGRRSSRFAERIADAAAKVGATGLVNIEGGIFRWHNESRPLVDASGPTRNVHGYDESWGRLVDDKSHAVLEPGGKPLGK